MSLLSVRNYLISALVADAKASGTNLDSVVDEIRRIYHSDDSSPVETSQTTKTKKVKKPRKKRTPSALDRFKAANRAEHQQTLQDMVNSGTATIKSKNGDKDLDILTKKGSLNMTTVASYQAKLWHDMSDEERAPFLVNPDAAVFGSETEEESDNS